MRTHIEVNCSMDSRCLESNVNIRSLKYRDFKYFSPPTVTNEDLTRIVDEFYIPNCKEDSTGKKSADVFLKIHHVKNGIPDDGLFIHMSAIKDESDIVYMYEMLKMRRIRVNPVTGDYSFESDVQREKVEILPGISFNIREADVKIVLREKCSFMYTRNYNRFILCIFDGTILQEILGCCEV